MSNTSAQPKKLRRPGVSILNHILKTIKLDERLIRENNQALQTFLATFIIVMKENDDLFKLLYQRPHYTGSFYSDLRISEPDEFDINLVLKLPFKPSDFEINYHPQVASYAKYRLKDPKSLEKVDPLLKKLFKDGYLMPEVVRKWIQSVVDKALAAYIPPYGITKVVPSSSGPARTMKLYKQNGMIDIDLVPVISCTLETKQPGIDGRVHAKFGNTLEAFLVPKPYSPPGQAPVNASEIGRLWRTHFPIAEDQLIRDLGCVKSVIRLLKLLRDIEGWKILASYYLKTVVMWMILENSDKEYWREDKLDERLIDAMQKLAGFVSEQKIPYFFSKKHNLISKMNNGQALSISKRLNSLINEVVQDSTKFWKIFHVNRTF